jgi:hypothetical protein
MQYSGCGWSAFKVVGMSSDLVVVVTGGRLCFAAANHTVKPTPNWCRWLIVLLEMGSKQAWED